MIGFIGIKGKIIVVYFIKVILDYIMNKKIVLFFMMNIMLDGKMYFKFYLIMFELLDLYCMMVEVVENGMIYLVMEVFF